MTQGIVAGGKYKLLVVVEEIGKNGVSGSLIVLSQSAFSVPHVRSYMDQARNLSTPALMVKILCTLAPTGTGES